MASIKAGSYTVGEVFRLAKFDFAEKASAEYLNGGPDFRRVQVGGLGFDSLEDRFTIPVTADTVDITVDGEVDLSLDVTLDEEQEAQRAYSFETAADAQDSRLAANTETTDE